ncbi:MAG: hypothetical protein FD123_761 [Bacteroidetes bacterium]|nr:MAG: hypothetical protein FD123_761 [Bacteroidota bacterium]
MRKFLIQVALFSIPLVAVTAGILFLKAPEKFQYTYLRDDCDARGWWLYQRLFTQEKPVDMAFIGTSRTMRGVNDSLLEGYLDSAGNHSKVLNAGYCRFGRDLEALVAGDILQTNPGLKKIIIEVNEKEGISGHPVYYCLADSRELLVPESFVNQEYFGNIYKGFSVRLDYLRRNFLQTEKPLRPGIAQFGCVHTDHRADTADLLQSKKHCFENPWNKAPGSWKKFQLRYTFAWLNHIVQQAKEQGCEIAFLYLPAYGCGNAAPRELEYYKQFGDVFIPPLSILDKPENWSDHDHFNSNGSRELTRWLYESLR